MEVPIGSRVMGLVSDLILVMAFFASWIVSGHGAGPIAVIMFAGTTEWFSVIALAWASIVILGSLPFMRKRLAYVIICVVGTLGLASAWLMILVHSDKKVLSTLGSVFFLASLVGRCIYLSKQCKDMPADRR
jgi:hypothetical protein